MATPSLPSCVNRVALTAPAICPVSKLYIPHRNGPSGRPENGIQPHGSSFFGNRGRIDAVAHAADQTAAFGHSGGPGHPWPPMATYGHLWPPLYSQVAHCYALVKTLHAGDRPRP